MNKRQKVGATLSLVFFLWVSWGIGLLPVDAQYHIFRRAPIVGGGACSGTFTFDTGTSWTPDCTGNVQIEIWGAGGAGSGWNGTANGAGGGAYSKRNTKAVTNGVAVTFTVGAGGVHGISSAGVQAGGNSTCDGMTANGGLASGGSATGGDVNTSGVQGTVWTSGTNGMPGGDAANVAGGGGIGGALASGTGNPGAAPGGGGSGAGSGGTQEGGNGAAGRVKITYL